MNHKLSLYVYVEDILFIFLNLLVLTAVAVLARICLFINILYNQYEHHITSMPLAVTWAQDLLVQKQQRYTYISF